MIAWWVPALNKGWQLPLLALSIFAGIAFPALAAFFKPYLLPLIFIGFLSAVLQVSFSDAAHAATGDRAIWIVLIWQLLGLPLLFFIVLKPFLSDQLYLFAVIAMCTGSITATTALSRLFNLNSALSLVAGMAGAILMPVPLYIFLQLLLGPEVSLDLTAYSIRSVFFIVVPFVVAFFIRKLISHEADIRLQENMPSVAMVFLVFFGLAVMDGVGELMFSDPHRLLSYVALAFGISIGVQLITFFVLFFLGARDATTCALLCAYRNVGFVAAIAGSSLGEDFFIFLGVWQFPMYVLPLLLRRFYENRATVN